MSGFVAITGDDDDDVTLFVEHIVSIMEDGRGCLVEMSNGKSFVFSSIAYKVMHDQVAGALRK